MSGGTPPLIVQLLACSLQQTQKHILVLAALHFLALKLCSHLGDHVLKHIDNFFLAVSACLSLSLNFLRYAVLLFRDARLHLKISLLTLHNLQLDLVVELGEVVFKARLEVFQCVITCLGLFGELGAQLTESIVHQIRQSFFHLQVGLSFI